MKPFKYTMTDSQFNKFVEDLDGLTIGGVSAEKIWLSIGEEQYDDFARRSCAFVKFAKWASKSHAPLTYDLLPSYKRHVLDATMKSPSAAIILTWLRVFLKACPDVPEEVWRSKLWKRQKKEAPCQRDFLYDLFGLTEGYTHEDLKKGYRRAALVFHPDHGGDQEVFMGIVAAYDFLTYGIGEMAYELYVRDGNNPRVEEEVLNVFQAVGGYSAIYKLKNSSHNKEN